MDLKSFHQAMAQLAEEKGISVERVVETIEMAVAAAYKKDFGKKGQIVRAKFNPETGEATFTQIKIVVDESMIKSEEEVAAEEEERARKMAEAAVSHRDEDDRRRRRDDDDDEVITAEGVIKKVRMNPEKHLMLDEAKKIKKDVKPGDELEFPLDTHQDFGRIASQTAKQVIIQRIREAEREAVFDEYKNKEGELVSGLVQRVEGRNIYVDLGRGVGLLPPEEQIPRENYRLGERIKAIILAVESSPKGPGIYLSRSHPRLLKKLFEIEVPEIAAGTVEIKAIAREAGSRSKIAVESKEDNIDPVGSLVGQKGVRVSTVINQLNGEKIDIIQWSDEPSKFVANSLSPARVVEVHVTERQKEARVMVPEDQLSLAIGKGGQNVRLAAKLTGWRIDVRSQKGEGEAASPETLPKPEVPAPAATMPAETPEKEKTEEKEKKSSSTKTSAAAKALADKPGEKEKTPKKKTTKKTK